MKVLSRIGAFELIDTLGRGGMGVVYRARDPGLDRVIALKVIPAERIEDTALRERFRREALSAAAVEHPHVVPVYDAGEVDGVLYLAMRLIEGADLGAVLRTERRLGPARAVALLSQVARALGAAHRQGLVHRDVKPSNVLIDPGTGEEHAYLTDFGLARLMAGGETLTDPGSWVGTLDYAAPEQLRGGPLDARTDVYALGALLYRALAGEVPYPGPDTAARMHAKLTSTQPPPQDEPGSALAGVVARALSPEPQERFESADAMADAMIAALDQGERPTESQPAARWPAGAETPHNLPPAPNRMIGRERDLAAVADLLRHGDRHLLTLVGPGGVGKTRLAIEAARALAADFTDGAAFVALAGAPPGADLATAVCGALGVPSAPGESAGQALRRFLGPRQLLLVLDGVEHLTGAPAFVGEIRECPGVTQLITSRAPLELGVEQLYVVPPLAVPSGEALFVERARAHDALLKLGPEDSAAVGEVCRRLDGLPLAIELAASATPLLAPRELAHRLSNALPLPATGPRDAPARQRTLEATFAWSYELLGDAEREAFERFAVFVGGSTVATAEQVTGADLATLQALVAKSLLARRETGREPRLLMLQTLREYALGRLAARGQAEDACERHLAWVLALAERAESGIGEPEQVAWLQRLDAEQENCLAALEWSVRRERFDLTLRLAGALAEYWYLRRGFADGMRFLEAGLGAPAELVFERARAHAGLGHLAAFRLGDSDRALRHLRRALQGFEEIGEGRRAAGTLSTIATVEAALGHREQAPATAARALRLARRCGDARTTGLALLAGVIASSDFAAGRPLLEEAVALFRRAGDRISLAVLLDNAGYLALIDGEYDQARVLLDDAVEVSRGNDDVVGHVYALENRAMVAVLNEDWDRAQPMLHEVFALCERHAVQAPLPEALAGAAAIRAVRGDHALAARLFGASRGLRFGQPVTPVEQRIEERFVAPCRERAGDVVWGAAERSGSGMGFDEAVAAGHQAAG